MAKHSRRSVSAPRSLSHSSVGTIELPNECSSNGETLPPLRFGAALPVSLQRWHPRITELAKGFALDIPIAVGRPDAHNDQHYPGETVFTGGWS